MADKRKEEHRGNGFCGGNSGDGACVCVCGGGCIYKWQQSKKNVLGESDVETVGVGEITADGQIQRYNTKQNEDETFPFFIWNFLKL